MIVFRSFLVQLMLGSGWMLSRGISPMGRRRPLRRGALGMVLLGGDCDVVVVVGYR